MKTEADTSRHVDANSIIEDMSTYRPTGKDLHVD